MAVRELSPQLQMKKLRFEGSSYTSQDFSPQTQRSSQHHKDAAEDVFSSE